jgi:lipopolysaccharide biosynthesis regulator YciM
MIRRRVLVVLAVFALLVPCFAQRRGSQPPIGPSNNTTRTCDVNVRVSLPNERPADKGVEVSLVSSQGGIVQQSFTDDMGSVIFRGITSGHYRLHISGIDIETVDLPVFEINQMETVHYEYAHITPKNTDNSGAGGGGMISAAELNIPDKARKEFDRGVEAMHKSENDKALDHFQKATVIYPQYSQAYNNIGVIEVKAGQTAQARQAFETAVSLNPKFASPYLNLARMSLADKQYKDADGFVTKALTAEPNRVDGVALAAETKLLLGDEQAAYAFARKVHGMGDHKGYSAVHLICAHVLEEKGDTQQAMAEYNLFLAESPDSPTAPKVRDEIARLGARAAAK